jgi:hypothetical protein
MCSCKTCGILAKTFSSRKDTGTHYALAAMHIGTPWSGSEARPRDGSPTDDVVGYPRQFCLTTRTPFVLDAVEQRGKALPRLDEVGSGSGTVDKSRIAQHPKVG